MKTECKIKKKLDELVNETIEFIICNCELDKSIKENNIKIAVLKWVLENDE